MFLLVIIEVCFMSRLIFATCTSVKMISKRISTTMISITIIRLWYFFTMAICISSNLPPALSGLQFLLLANACQAPVKNLSMSERVEN